MYVDSAIEVEAPTDVELLQDEHGSRYGHQNRWRTVDGVEIPPPNQEKFMTEWCMQWPRPCTQRVWADQEGVSLRSIQYWLNDERFCRVWNKRADTLYSSPQWTHPAITRAYEIGMGIHDGYSASDQAAFMKLYFTMVGKMTPKLRVEHEIVPLPTVLAAMSDSELVSVATGTEIVDAEIIDD